MKKRYVILITVIATLGVLFALSKLFGGNKTAVSETSVIIESPAMGELTEYVSAPGEIEPIQKVYISAKVSAKIIELPFEEGQSVTRGDPEADPPVPASVLVRLDDSDLQSELTIARANKLGQEAQIKVEKARMASQKADIKGIEASLEQARKDLERQRKLFESKDISRATLDQTELAAEELEARYEAAKYQLNAAEMNLKVLKYNLESAEARIRQAEEALEYTTIKSPIDGVVTLINAEVGEVVVYGTMNNPGTVILQVADLSQMILTAQVDEADIAEVRKGQNANVRVQAYPGRVFGGKVRSIALVHRISGTGTKYYETEILLDNDEEVELYSGLTADVDIETKYHEDVLTVPTQAVLGRRIDSLPADIRENNPLVNTEKTYATVVYRYVDNKAVVTPVKIGSSNLIRTIVEEGLRQEDKIIAGPYKVLENLSNEQRVIDEKEKKEGDKNEAGGAGDKDEEKAESETKSDEGGK